MSHVICDGDEEHRKGSNSEQSDSGGRLKQHGRLETRCWRHRVASSSALAPRARGTSSCQHATLVIRVQLGVGAVMATTLSKACRTDSIGGGRIERSDGAWVAAPVGRLRRLSVHWSQKRSFWAPKTKRVNKQHSGVSGVSQNQGLSTRRPGARLDIVSDGRHGAGRDRRESRRLPPATAAEVGAGEDKEFGEMLCRKACGAAQRRLSQQPSQPPRARSRPASARTRPLAVQAGGRFFKASIER